MSDHSEISAAEASELELARTIALQAHLGQSDKAGHPYIEHCERVASRVQDTKEKTVAFLHDLLEKCHGWDIDRLRQLGFSNDVVDAVDALTRRRGEADDQFVIRAIANKLACPVKVADLEDNLRQANASGSDAGKYKRGLEVAAMVHADPDFRRLT
ncbi:hypothetical protein ASE04_18700 [Rhizobium sp. Root708]|uniref:HD domain-containing protein n=1 Tax=Rhizobium sp. Root708 TaxID=1736592 RepID=UPI0007021A50|nr:HD domain-containing protein [Rhizobium sp. Root708]KRB49208.1 hypothetical protein ASE04_18700 [Rhizobium sp. Root708]